MNRCKGEGSEYPIVKLRVILDKQEKGDGRYKRRENEIL